jgi:hypothetical protein
MTPAPTVAIVTITAIAKPSCRLRLGDSLGTPRFAPLETTAVLPFLSNNAAWRSGIARKNNPKIGQVKAQIGATY